MKVLTFEKRFALPVESGAKTRTIRKRRKRFISSGEPLSLREWMGKPYASKQRVLREVESCEVETIVIYEMGVKINPGTVNIRYLNSRIERQELEAFAREDGFTDWDDMKTWFQKTHGLPFEGVLITWEK